MDDPSEKDEPKQEGQRELDEGSSQATLEQLPEPRDEEAAQRSEYVPT